MTLSENLEWGDRIMDVALAKALIWGLVELALYAETIVPYCSSKMIIYGGIVALLHVVVLFVYLFGHKSTIPNYIDNWWVLFYFLSFIYITGIMIILGLIKSNQFLLYSIKFITLVFNLNLYKSVSTIKVSYLLFCNTDKILHGWSAQDFQSQHFSWKFTHICRYLSSWNLTCVCWPSTLSCTESIARSVRLDRRNRICRKCRSHLILYRLRCRCWFFCLEILRTF